MTIVSGVASVAAMTFDGGNKNNPPPDGLPGTLMRSARDLEFEKRLRELRDGAGMVPLEGGKFSHLRFIVATVEPEFAEYLLRVHNKRNRNLRKSAVSKYKRDILLKSWGLTHQGIAFLADADISLGDGQHRLEAIRQSGEAVALLICFDLPRKEVLNIDTAAKRDPGDNINFAYGTYVDQPMKVVAGGMMLGFNYEGASRTVSPAILHEFITKHHEAVEFVATMSRGVKDVAIRRPVQAVIGRAYYHIKHDMLSEFFEVLKTGMRDGRSVASEEKYREIMKLREFLIDSVNRGNGREQFVSTYRKTERVLKNFADGTPGQRLVDAKSEEFPLPGENIEE